MSHMVPDISGFIINKLQKVHNEALRIATEPLKMTFIAYLYSEISITKIQDHLDMIGTQFINRALSNMNFFVTSC